MDEQTIANGNADDATPAPSSGSDAGASARRRVRLRTIRTVVVVALAVVALGVAFDLGTTSPRLCTSCHEMEPRYQSWTESAHAAVGCVECHQEPTAWYALPKRVFDRGRLLGRDVIAHVSGDFADPVDGPIAGVPPMSDSVCLDCHDPNRKATSGFRILIDHPEHAK